ncbi:MAG: flavodoxin family protein [Oscillospiraceae bacterium]|jgi:multimeric flavodoxin WrbA|nr:flavodoxin family protein [Oscillospiraceae bacterium]
MYIVITSSPNQDGLTDACGKAAIRGITGGNGKVEHIDLCADDIQPCLVCGNGWGICRNEHRCVVGDCLSEYQDKIEKAQGLFLITPVYWGQPSEKMKFFCDRIRRCEALRKEQSVFAGKKVNIVAAAGGSGNGTVTCLAEMEAWSRHVGAVPHERIGITRYNRDKMLDVIELAGAHLAEGE